MTRPKIKHNCLIFQEFNTENVNPLLRIWCQCVKSIIENINFIIKVRQRRFVDFAKSDFMTFTLNSFHQMSQILFVLQNISVLLMTYLSYNNFIHTFCFLCSLESSTRNNYIFGLYLTNSLIDKQTVSFFILPVFELL